MATAKKTDTKVVPFPGDPEVTAELSRALGLTDAEVQRAVKELARNLTHAELGVLSVMWSERESQKTSRAHTRRFPVTGAHVLRSGTGGAAALDLGDGLCAVFSMTAAEDGELGAAATLSLGSALRNVLALGAEPLSLFDTLRLGGVNEDTTRTQLKEIAQRLAGYAKAAGVPISGGDLEFDPRYTQAALVHSLGLGIARTENLLETRATELGNTLVYVGASLSRAPVAESQQRRLSAGCLEAYKLGSVEGAAAVGASGVAGAVVRLAARGGTGIELDLDALPRQGERLSPFQLLCLPTEAMVLVVRKGREEAVLEALRQQDLEGRVIGRVTNTGRLVCKASPEGDKSDAKQALIVADLPVSLLTQDAPQYERALKPAELNTVTPEVSLKRNEDAESELVRLLGSANVGSRDWLIRRFEAATKQGAGRNGPSSAALIRFSTESGDTQVEKTLAVSLDGHARYAQLDPRQGAAMAVAECARNVVCAGAEPLGLAYCLSVGDLEQPESVWRLSEMVDGIRDACLALKLPVVQGTPSIRQGTTLSTPTVAVIGQLRDPGDRVGLGFARQADMVALLGTPGTGNLAGSEFLVARTGELRGRPLTVDLGAEVKLQRALLELARERLLSSAHDVSDGGLGVALAECCIVGRVGCSVELPGGVDPLAMLFHEEPSRAIVSFAPEQRAKVQERCEALGVPFFLLGFVGGDTLEIEEVLDIPVQVLAESHARALVRLVED